MAPALPDSRIIREFYLGLKVDMSTDEGTKPIFTASIALISLAHWMAFKKQWVEPTSAGSIQPPLDVAP